MSNLPPDWTTERLEHHLHCRTQCEWDLEDRDGVLECDNGHTDHDCNCDELAADDAEHVADAWAEWALDHDLT